MKGPLNIGRSPQGHPVVLQAGGSEAGQSLAARTADIVFSVVQDIDEAKAGYASLKNRLPAFGRKPDDVTVLPGVMPIVGRTDKEAFEKAQPAAELRQRQQRACHSFRSLRPGHVGLRPGWPHSGYRAT